MTIVSSIVLTIATIGAPTTAAKDFQATLYRDRYLRIPPGVHVLKAPLVVPSKSTIEGSGPTSVLSFPGIKTGPCIVNEDWQDTKPGASQIKLRKFAVKGGCNGLPSGPIAEFSQGIRLQKVDQFTIEEVFVSHTHFGMFVVGSQRGSILDCQVHHTGRDGIHLVANVCEGVDEFDGRSISNISIAGCRVYSVGDDCIAVHCGAESGRNQNTRRPPTGISVMNNSLGPHPTHPLAQGRGIIFTGVQGGKIVGNSIDNTVSCGLWLQEDHHASVDPAKRLRCRDVMCTANVLRNVGRVQGVPNKPKHAIRLIGVHSCSVSANMSYRHADRLIRGNRVQNTTCAGNVAIGGESLIELLNE